MMKKMILLLFASLVFASSSSAAPIPPEVKSVVTFIYIKAKNGQLVPNGTGFFISVKDTQKANYYWVYLVTAKHVFQQDDHKSLLPEVFIRLNKKNGDVEYIRIPLIAKPVPLPLIIKGDIKNVYFHEDSSVDLAVIPFLPDKQIYDFKYITDEWITTKEDFLKLNIREGSEIFFTGLFLSHIGEHKNYPIVRFGRVALVTDEKVDWNGIKTDLYLIESASYGGNSGSPVFFSLEPERKPGLIMLSTKPILKLAGIMQGVFGERKPIQFTETAKVPVATSNVGIAAVIPAYKLYEILFGNDLKKLRTSK